MDSAMPNMVSVLMQKPERREHAEGAQQHHRHRDRRDERGAHVLQEQIHHQEHEHDGFDQRLHHLDDRGAHERRGVERVDHSPCPPGRTAPAGRAWRGCAFTVSSAFRPAARRMATPAAGLPLYLVSRV